MQSYSFGISICGNELTGKTTYVNALLGGNLSDAKNKDRTKGVRIYHISDLDKEFEGVKEEKDILQKNRDYDKKKIVIKDDVKMKDTVIEHSISTIPNMKNLFADPNTKLRLYDIAGLNGIDQETNNYLRKFVNDPLHEPNIVLYVTAYDARSGTDNVNSIRLILEHMKMKKDAGKDIYLIPIMNKCDMPYDKSDFDDASNDIDKLIADEAKKYGVDGKYIFKTIQYQAETLLVYNALKYNRLDILTERLKKRAIEIALPGTTIDIGNMKELADKLKSKPLDNSKYEHGKKESGFSELKKKLIQMFTAEMQFTIIWNNYMDQFRQKIRNNITANEFIEMLVCFDSLIINFSNFKQDKNKIDYDKFIKVLFSTITTYVSKLAKKDAKVDQLEINRQTEELISLDKLLQRNAFASFQPNIDELLKCEIHPKLKDIKDSRVNENSRLLNAYKSFKDIKNIDEFERTKVATPNQWENIRQNLRELKENGMNADTLKTFVESILLKLSPVITDLQEKKFFSFVPEKLIVKFMNDISKEFALGNEQINKIISEWIIEKLMFIWKNMCTNHPIANDYTYFIRMHIAKLGDKYDLLKQIHEQIYDNFKTHTDYYLNKLYSRSYVNMGIDFAMIKYLIDGTYDDNMIILKIVENENKLSVAITETSISTTTEAENEFSTYQETKTMEKTIEKTSNDVQSEVPENVVPKLKPQTPYVRKHSNNRQPKRGSDPK